MQEFFDPLHALFILDLRQRIFYRINRIVISKIHFRSHIGLFIDIEDMLLLRRAMKDDILFFRRQIAEGHINPHAHFLGNILHQRPHKRLPRRHRPLCNGQAFVRHEAGFINRTHNPCPGAMRASTF